MGDFLQEELNSSNKKEIRAYFKAKAGQESVYEEFLEKVFTQFDNPINNIKDSEEYELFEVLKYTKTFNIYY